MLNPLITFMSKHRQEKGIVMYRRRRVKIIKAGKTGMKEVVSKKIDILGSAGKV